MPLTPQVIGDHFFYSGLDAVVLIVAWPLAVRFLRSLRIVGRKRRLGFNDRCAANRFFAVPSTPGEDAVNFRENRWREAQEIFS